MEKSFTENQAFEILLALIRSGQLALPSKSLGSNPEKTARDLSEYLSQIYRALLESKR